LNPGGVAAAGALDWSAGDRVLAAASQHGLELRAALGELAVAKRHKVEDAAFTALYLTPDERDELDELAVAGGDRCFWLTGCELRHRGSAVHR